MTLCPKRVIDTCEREKERERRLGTYEKVCARVESGSGNCVLCSPTLYCVYAPVPLTYLVERTDQEREEGEGRGERGGERETGEGREGRRRGRENGTGGSFDPVNGSRFEESGLSDVVDRSYRNGRTHTAPLSCSKVSKEQAKVQRWAS